MKSICPIKRPERKRTSSPEEREKVTWQISGGSDLASKPLKAKDSVKLLMFEAVSTLTTALQRVKQIIVSISYSVQGSFSSGRPPQQENVGERVRERKPIFAGVKTAENNGGLLWTINAFTMTQPAANWEQTWTDLDDHPRKSPPTTAGTPTPHSGVKKTLKPWAMVIFMFY